VSAGITTTTTNTYSTVAKFVVPAKIEICMEGKNIPDNMKRTALTYSDVKINVKIADEIFIESKECDFSKPTENAETLFAQAEALIKKGGEDTAKLKLRQIVTYYPDDPLAKKAKMMLDKAME
jgi:hypothetical protein